MLTDMLGLGRTAFTAVNEGADILPEVEEITLESVEDIDGDPFEFMVSAVYENELNFERIEKCMILDEYAYLLENNQEMVFEAGKLKGFFEKAKNAILGIWKKITQFFKTVFAKFSDIIKGNKKFAEKYIAVFKQKKVNNLSATLENEVTWYASAKEIIGAGETYLTNAGTEAGAALEDFNVTTPARTNVIKKITGKPESDIDSAFKKQFTKKTKSVTVSISDLEELKSSDKDLDGFKRLYNISKTSVDSCLKCLKSVEKNLDKDGDVKKATSNVNYVKKISNLLPMIDKATVGYANKRYSFIRKSTAAVLKNADSKKGKEPVNASASFIESVELL